MANKTVNVTGTSDREIVMTKVLDAPRELVFKVWTDPEHMVKWWGPEGFTTTLIELDLRPGGAWRFIMHGPDGRDFPNKIVFTEIVKPERLAYTHSDDGGPLDVTFEVLVTFEKQGDKTKLTMRSVFESAEILDYLNSEFHATEGGIQHLQRLHDYLTSINQ